MTRLKIDLDRPFSGCAWSKWCERFADAVEVLALTPSSVMVRRTGRGFHVEVDVTDDLDHAQVIATQAILGSDALREAHNLRRLREGEGVESNVLFRIKARSDGTITRTTPNIPFAARLRRELKGRGWTVIVRPRDDGYELAVR